MFRSLTLQVLWAPALVLALAGAGLAAQARLLADTQSAPISQERNLVVGSARLLATRHARTLRRVRLAILDPKIDNRVAILNDTAQHYQRSMRSLTAEFRERLASLRLVDEKRAERLSQRTAEILDAIDTEIALVASSVEGLRDRVVETPPEDLNVSLIEFERAEQTVSQRLSRLDGISRQLMTLRTERLLEPRFRIPPWLWPSVGVLALASLLFSALRLRRLLRDDLAPGSDVETVIRDRRNVLERRLESVNTELGRANRGRSVAEQARRREEREHALLRIYNENLVNSLRSAVVVTDLEGLVTGFNRAAREWLAPELGTSILDHALGHCLRRGVPNANAALERARQRDSLKASALRYDDERLIDLRIVAYLDERESARGLLWLVEDVTEPVETKNRLLAAERLAAVGRLSAQVAHEIRNPLSAIGLNAELLEEELDDGIENPDEARTLLRAIANEIERLTEVTEGYLQLTRVPDPHAEGCDLNEALRDLLTMLAPELSSHRVRVELDLADHGTRAWVDPGQLRQALLNVIRNAREAMPSGGTLTLRSGRAGERVFVEVEDEGPGIDPSVRTRVFEPFFTTKPEGTGLGLSLTQQFVREQNGEVSLGDGRSGGARVRIVLPLDPSSSATAN